MTTFKHTTIESMRAKSLIAALSYYNDRVRYKSWITFTKFVERCVEVNRTSHDIIVHYNPDAEDERTKYGFIDEQGNLMTIEQAEQSFTGWVIIEQAFFHLFQSEEEKIVNVLNKAQKPVDYIE